MLKKLFNQFALYFVAAAFAIGLFSGIYGMHVLGAYSDAKEYKKQVDAHLAQENELSEKAAKLEQELAAQRQENRTINQRLQNEIFKNSVYHSCVVPADGVRILQDAVSGRKAAGKHGK